jgi:hypothetical protein
MKLAHPAIQILGAETILFLIRLKPILTSPSKAEN